MPDAGRGIRTLKKCYPLLDPKSSAYANAALPAITQTQVVKNLAAFNESTI
jgi:hypothetical protein